MCLHHALAIDTRLNHSRRSDYGSPATTKALLKVRACRVEELIERPYFVPLLPQGPGSDCQMLDVVAERSKCTLLHARCY
jgi:hypothetical protein